MYTLAITHYNRVALLKESFAEIINDDRIDEILIMDDASNEDAIAELKQLSLLTDKLDIFIQPKNVGMAMNKRDAIAMAKNNWVIIFDSDNIIKSNYLDVIPDKLVPTTIYMPDFAWPNFDYRKFSGRYFDISNIDQLINDSMGNCCMNTCNYLVNKNFYCQVWKKSNEVIATDTIYFNYLWLQAGYSFYIVKDMTYYHRVHSGSGFLEYAEYNLHHAEQIKKTILKLHYDHGKTSRPVR